MTTTITPEALAELIAPMLAGTYHCGRVWSAWQVGTMSEDDFAPVEESDTPHDIAAAILAALPELLAAQPASSAGEQEPVGEVVQLFATTKAGQLFKDLPLGTKIYAAPVAGEAAQRMTRDEASELAREIIRHLGIIDAAIDKAITAMEADAPPSSASIAVEHVSVIQQDANNYCLILRLLGMEDEGDPVAEVRQLVESRDSKPAAQGADLGVFRGWLCTTGDGSVTDWTRDEDARERFAKMGRAVEPIYSGIDSPQGDSQPCYVCGEVADSHPWEAQPGGGKKRGACPAAQHQQKESGDAQ